MLYKLTQVTKTHGQQTVLDIPFLEIEKEKIYALLGPNGAGKSTLINILGFLDSPTGGTVYYKTRKVSFAESALQPLRKEVVLVNQHPILFTTTVYENVEFGLKIRRVPPKKRQRMIEEALDLTGMRHMVNAFAQNLSGGETQRVAISRALALNPKVILFDEPTSSVDLENQIAIINLLQRINTEKKISLVFTTHDKPQASTLAGTIIFLDHGKPTTASYENLFSGVLEPQGNGLSRCTIQNQCPIWVPDAQTGRVRLLIDPKKIYMLDSLSQRDKANILRGKVLQIAEDKSRIRVVVNAGILITLFMSREQYQNKPPMVGEQVLIEIPPEAVRIL